MFKLMLIVVALLAFRVPDRGAKLYYVLLLMLETAALGVFMARDWSLFYVFWEMTLIPLFFLIERLGGAQRRVMDFGVSRFEFRAQGDNRALHVTGIRLRQREFFFDGRYFGNHHAVNRGSPVEPARTG